MMGSFIKFLLTVLVAAGIFFQTPPCLAKSAASWETSIISHKNIPPRLIAVDKKRQHIFVYERKSPISLVSSYLCTTGQTPGDKLVEGDLKTPEGVYFITQHLTSGLDFEMYGNEAYPLNYPNPVDRLRKKSGYGIWIHGRGYDIAPLQTQGCIALNNPDLSTLGKFIEMGMPVVLSSALHHATTTETSTAVDSLEKLVTGWANAWAGRSATMFDFYDQDAYSVATEPFSAFRKQKERLFKTLPWIKTTVSNIQVLQGPGYWVTWFHQEYEAPNLATSGVRRLYWEERAKGDFKIIGMEWVPGLTTGPLLALAEAPVPPIEEYPRTEHISGADSPPAPLPADSSGPQTPTLATSETPPDNAANRDRLVAAVDQKTPQMDSANASEAVKDLRVEIPPALTATDAEPQPPVSRSDLAPDPAPDSTEEAEAPAPSDFAAVVPEITRRIEEWRLAWEAGNVDRYTEFYHATATQGRRSSAKSIKKHKLSLWKKAAPASVDLGDIRISQEGQTIRAEMYQEYSDVTGAGDKGIKTLVLEHSGGQWLITQEEWSPLSQ